MSPFYIRIEVDRKIFRLKVEQRNLTPIHEEFVITARNGKLVLKSNRPLLRGKGIRKRDPELLLIDGQLKYSSFEREIKKQLINHLDKIEKNNIFIEFEHRGRIVSGEFGKVQGAGDSSVWHLNSKGLYLGRLRKGSDDQWVFDESDPKDELKYLARFFGNYITEQM